VVAIHPAELKDKIGKIAIDRLARMTFFPGLEYLSKPETENNRRIVISDETIRKSPVCLLDTTVAPSIQNRDDHAK
jgi:hypothetical protein